MKFSIIVPTYNNLNFLKFFLTSIKNNSVYNHQVILHINDGSDGTLNFAKKNNLLFKIFHPRFSILFRYGSFFSP